MKNGFDELISTLGMAEGRILEFEDISVETSKTEKQKENTDKKKGNKISKNYGATTIGVIYMQWDVRRGIKGESNRRNIWSNND